MLEQCKFPFGAEHLVTSYGELKNGTKVNVVGVSSGWYKVTYNGKTGYIHPDYITLASSSAGTAIAPSNTVTSTTGTAVR